MSKGEKVIPFPEGNRNEALRRIREAAETGQTALNLCDLGLDVLPRELETLKGLQHLLLGTDRPVSVAGRLSYVKPTFTDLSPVAALTSLQSLHLNAATKLRDLSPLSSLVKLKTLHLDRCVAVGDLAPLESLIRLEQLSLSYCKNVQNLKPLAGLGSLRTLDLTRCVAVTDYRSLAGLTGLRSLKMGKSSDTSRLNPDANLVLQLEQELSRCGQPTDFSFLAGLSELRELDLSGCHQLTSLEPLANLTQLTELSLAACSRVSSIEPLAGLSQLTDLNLTMCSSIPSLEPLNALTQLERLWINFTVFEVPFQYVSEGDASAILTWLQGVNAGPRRPLTEIKLLLLGQGRVGKSHLRRRIFESNSLDYYDGRLEPTQNVDCLEYMAALPDGHSIQQAHNNSQLRMRVWDFGGQSHLHSAHRFFLGGERCFYVLVLAADRPANGEAPQSNRLNYWLRMISRYGRTVHGEAAPVVIVVTRSDEPAASANAPQLEEALQAAKRHDWFGAKVVRVVRGMGWSRSLTRSSDAVIWNRHKAAADEVAAAIADHLDQVPGLQAPVPFACQSAKEFIERAFGRPEPASNIHRLNPDSSGGDQQTRPYLAREEVLAGWSGDPAVRKRGQEMRRIALGLLNHLGVVHWVGDRPEIVRRNPWGLKELVFNPEWVKRPVYDLLWRVAPQESRAGFLSDRQVQDVLVVRSGNPRGTDLYERMPFTEEDRGRVLELMKACRLIFDSPHEPGILVPDLLETARLTDVEVSQKGWRYSADFLPEKVMLRFIAEQYRSIDTRIGECFRNRVVWKRGEQSIILESHFSPPGGTRPYLLIRPVSADEDVSESVAANIGLLLDEIFVDEGLGDVRRELAPDVEGRLDGKFVFRRLPMPVRRGEIVKPKFSIVFDGVDLGFDWDHLNGLEYLHMLIRQPGEPCHVQTLSSATTSDNRNDYRIKQNTVERKQASLGEPNTGRRLAKHHPKKLKELLKTLEAKLANTEDEEERQMFAQQIEDIVHELERRNSPAMTKLMRTTQQSIKRSIGELKAAMREKGIPEAELGHFDHCGSSEGHPFHFSYRPAVPVKWETE